MEKKQLNLQVDIDIYEKIKRYSERFDLSTRKAVSGLIRGADEMEYVAKTSDIKGIPGAKKPKFTNQMANQWKNRKSILAEQIISEYEDMKERYEFVEGARGIVEAWVEEVRGNVAKRAKVEAATQAARSKGLSESEVMAAREAASIDIEKRSDADEIEFYDWMQRFMNDKNMEDLKMSERIFTKTYKLTEEQQQEFDRVYEEKKAELLAT